jgi:hypothetical protein
MLKIALLPWKERKILNVSPESFHVHWNTVRCMRTFELSLCSRFTISNLCTVQHNYYASLFPVHPNSDLSSRQSSRKPGQ